MTDRLELAQKKAYYDIGTAKGPDVYFEPKVVRKPSFQYDSRHALTTLSPQVWEVLAADLSLSPIYSAAKGAPPPSSARHYALLTPC